LIADCGRAIELDPLRFAHVNRAPARGNKKDYARIADAPGPHLEPNNFFSISYRGWARVSKGDNDGAIADCNRTIERAQLLPCPNNRAGPRSTRATTRTASGL
jgi:hypothetical protein